MSDSKCLYKLALCGGSFYEAILTVESGMLEKLKDVRSTLFTGPFCAVETVAVKFDGELAVKSTDGENDTYGPSLEVRFQRGYTPVLRAYIGQEVKVVDFEIDAAEEYDPDADCTYRICPVCGRRVYAEQGYEFWAAGCDHCGIYTRQHAFTEESALDEFSEVATRLTDWKVGNTPSPASDAADASGTSDKGEDIATYKIDLDEATGMRYALLTISRTVLDEIASFDAELDAIQGDYTSIVRAKAAFQVAGTIRIRWTDGTETEYDDMLTVCFSEKHHPGIVVTHKGEEYMIFVACNDSDEIKENDKEADEGSR